MLFKSNWFYIITIRLDRSRKAQSFQKSFKRSFLKNAYIRNQYEFYVIHDFQIADVIL